MIMIIKIDTDKILINHHHHNNQRSVLTSPP